MDSPRLPGSHKSSDRSSRSNNNEEFEVVSSMNSIIGTPSSSISAANSTHHGCSENNNGNKEKKDAQSLVTQPCGSTKPVHKQIDQMVELQQSRAQAELLADENKLLKKQLEDAKRAMAQRDEEKERLERELDQSRSVMANVLKCQIAAKRKMEEEQEKAAPTMPPNQAHLHDIRMVETSSSSILPTKRPLQQNFCSSTHQMQQQTKQNALEMSQITGWHQVMRKLEHAEDGENGTTRLNDLIVHVPNTGCENGQIGKEVLNNLANLMNATLIMGGTRQGMEICIILVPNDGTHRPAYLQWLKEKRVNVLYQLGDGAKSNIGPAHCPMFYMFTCQYLLMEIAKGQINLANLRFLLLESANFLINDHDFARCMLEIRAAAKKDHQILVFSQQFTDELMAIIASILRPGYSFLGIVDNPPNGPPSSNLVPLSNGFNSTSHPNFPPNISKSSGVQNAYNPRTITESSSTFSENIEASSNGIGRLDDEQNLLATSLVEMSTEDKFNPPNNFQLDIWHEEREEEGEENGMNVEGRQNDIWAEQEEEEEEEWDENDGEEERGDILMGQLPNCAQPSTFCPIQNCDINESGLPPRTSHDIQAQSIVEIIDRTMGGEEQQQRGGAGGETGHNQQQQEAGKNAGNDFVVAANIDQQQANQDYNTVSTSYDIDNYESALESLGGDSWPRLATTPTISTDSTQSETSSQNSTSALAPASDGPASIFTFSYGSSHRPFQRRSPVTSNAIVDLFRESPAEEGQPGQQEQQPVVQQQQVQAIHGGQMRYQLDALLDDHGELRREVVEKHCEIAQEMRNLQQRMCHLEERNGYCQRTRDDLIAHLDVRLDDVEGQLATTMQMGIDNNGGEEESSFAMNNRISEMLEENAALRHRLGNLEERMERVEQCETLKKAYLLEYGNGLGENNCNGELIIATPLVYSDDFKQLILAGASIGFTGIVVTNGAKFQQFPGTFLDQIIQHSLGSPSIQGMVTFLVLNFPQSHKPKWPNCLEHNNIFDDVMPTTSSAAVNGTETRGRIKRRAVQGGKVVYSLRNVHCRRAKFVVEVYFNSPDEIYRKISVFSLRRLIC